MFDCGSLVHVKTLPFIVGKWVLSMYLSSATDYDYKTMFILIWHFWHYILQVKTVMEVHLQDPILFSTKVDLCREKGRQLAARKSRLGYSLLNSNTCNMAEVYRSRPALTFTVLSLTWLCLYMHSILLF
jgi:hypothetical protein